MACTIEDVTGQFDPRDFDKPLGDLLIGYDGNASNFLVTVLDFLKRKSNFFNESDAKRRVLDAYRQVAGETDGLKGGFLGQNKSAAAKSAAASARKPIHEVRALSFRSMQKLSRRLYLPLLQTSAQVPAKPQQSATTAPEVSPAEAADPSSAAVAAPEQQPNTAQELADAEPAKLSGLSKYFRWVLLHPLDL